MADALLRFQNPTSALFLAPSSTSRWVSSRKLDTRSLPQRSVSRDFTTTTQRYALRPSVITTATPPPTKDTLSETSSSTKNSAEESIEELSNALWTSRSTRPPTLPRPAQHASSKGYTPPSLSREKEFLMNGGTSADDLLATLNEHRKSDPVRNSSAFDLSRMLDPSSSLVQDSTRGMMAGLQRDITSAKTERMKMKLNPSTGRSVSIGMGIDVGRGFR